MQAGGDAFYFMDTSNYEQIHINEESLGDSALTDERAIGLQANGQPNTFVPARNLLFLTAYCLGVNGQLAERFRQGVEALVERQRQRAGAGDRELLEPVPPDLEGRHPALVRYT